MKPIAASIPRLRQRRRTDGTWRVWWEAEAAVRALGYKSVELDPEKPTWSAREAERLNRAVDRKRKGGPPRTGGRTVEDLVERYRKSRKFLGLSDASRTSYDKNLRLIVTKWGGYPVGHFTKAVMHTWYETLFAHSGEWQARALIRMMSILFSYAELIGWREDNSNPCMRLGLSQPKGRSRTASWDEIDALTDAADALGLPEMALAILLSALQGQRQTDVRLARVQDFSKVTVPASAGRPQETLWVWRWTRSKRQNAGIAPVHPEVAPRLSAAISGHPVEHERLLLDARTGRPHAADLFEKRWAEVRAAAALPCPSVTTLQFRDLRRTFGNLARAGGASKDDTADVLGNSAATNAQLGEIYMAPQFETARRAIDAVRRPEKRKRA